MHYAAKRCTIPSLLYTPGINILSMNAKIILKDYLFAISKYFFLIFSFMGTECQNSNYKMYE